jgi:hypothetical protein
MSEPARRWTQTASRDDRTCGKHRADLVTRGLPVAGIHGRANLDALHRLIVSGEADCRFWTAKDPTTRADTLAEH